MIDLPSVGKAAKQRQIVQIVIGRTSRWNQDRDRPASSPARWPLPSRPCRAPVQLRCGHRADRSVKYETVVKVADTLQRAGISAWAIRATAP
jgi:biopolymer transport protein TolR